MERLAFSTRNWMEYVDIAKLTTQINGRDVYLWNEHQESFITSFLTKQGIPVKGNLMEQVNDSIPGKESYLFISSGWGRDVSLMSLFTDRGLVEEADYCYLTNQKELSGLFGYYKDNCSNEIICEAQLQNVKIVLQGYGNRVYIGKDFGCRGQLTIYLKGNAKVHFGRNLFSRGGEMFFQDSVSEFAGNSYLAGNLFFSNFGGSLSIGKELEALDGLYICVAEKTSLKIGDGCMMGKDVKILSGAAHSLFDLNTKENINMDPNTHVTIGDHVWLGMGSSVLYSCEIKDHSMLGADSVAKGIYPPHSALAGNIARVVRENIDWDHDDYVSYEEYEARLQLHQKE